MHTCFTKGYPNSKTCLSPSALQPCETKFPFSRISCPQEHRSRISIPFCWWKNIRIQKHHFSVYSLHMLRSLYFWNRAGTGWWKYFVEPQGSAVIKHVREQTITLRKLEDNQVHEIYQEGLKEDTQKTFFLLLSVGVSFIHLKN